jgi:hypothetical protein
VNEQAGSVYKGLAITLFTAPFFNFNAHKRGSHEGFSATPGGIKTVFVRFL